MDDFHATRTRYLEKMCHDRMAPPFNQDTVPVAIWQEASFLALAEMIERLSKQIGDES